MPENRTDTDESLVDVGEGKSPGPGNTDRIFAWILVLAGAISVLTYIWFEKIAFHSDLNFRMITRTIAGMGLMLIPGGLLIHPRSRMRLMRFFRGLVSLVIPATEDPLRLRAGTSDTDAVRKIEELLHRKLADLQTTRIELEPSERAALVSGIADGVAKSMTVESVEELRKRLGATRLSEEVDATKARLSDAIQKTASRTTNNLVFGIVFSVVAVAILFFSLSPGQLDKTAELLRYFMPRISIVLLVELVAYFFLKLYKSGIEEIRYYQNELTNVEAQSAAMEAALLANDEALIKSVVTKIAATERNFVLAKGATTVEVEKAKLQHEHWAELAQAIASVAKSK